jgi:hypothetical protein
MGLFKKAGKSAAVVGTAKVVVGALSKRLASRHQEKPGTAGAQQPSQLQDAPPPAQAAAPPAPAPTTPQQASTDPSLGGQLQQLATLRDQGALSEDEVTAAKARLLGT